METGTNDVFGAEAHRAVRGMAAGRDHVSTHVLSDFMCGIVARAAEMAMPVFGAVVGALAAAGHVDEKSAFVLDGARMWSPLDAGASALVAMLPGASGRREVATAALMGGRDGSRDRLRVHVFARNWKKALRDLRGDGYVPDMMAEGSPSIDMTKISGYSGWLSLSDSHAYHDAWQDWFGIVERAARALGVGETVSSSVAEYRSRVWKDPADRDATLSGYTASRSASLHAVGIDEGLPSTGARRFADAVESLAMGMDLTRMVASFDAVADLCAANGHGPEGSDFDFDDMDSTVRVSSTHPDGSIALHLTDQNCSLVLRASADRTRWAFWRGRDAGIEDGPYDPETDDEIDLGEERNRLAPELRAAFDGSADVSTAAMTFAKGPERFLPDRVLTGGIADVRAWNSLVVDVEGALHELRREYDVPAAPSV